jgi:hypothetical protein
VSENPDPPLACQFDGKEKKNPSCSVIIPQAATSGQFKTGKEIY